MGLCLVMMGGGVYGDSSPKTPEPQLEAYESWKMAGRDKGGALTSAFTIFAPYFCPKGVQSGVVAGSGGSGGLVGGNAF